MRKIALFLVFSLLSGSLVFSQEKKELPKLETNPDFLTTIKVLDSVIQYTFSAQIDSSLLHKWDYHIDEKGFHQSRQYYWRDSTRDWFVTDMYNWDYDGSGKLILKSHYDHLFSNGTWGGCDSDGCGKKEWAYDNKGNQVLFTQSYFTNTRKWEIFEIHENQYDQFSNMVLHSNLEKVVDNGESYWEGYKDEYSYNRNNYQTGHVNFRWTNYDPIDVRDYNDWGPLFKEDQAYNGNGLITKNAYYVWDYEHDEWLCGKHSSSFDNVEWDYDLTGRRSLVRIYITDSLIISEEFKYNNLGQVLSKIEVAQLDLPRVYFLINGWPYFPNNIIPVKKEYEYDVDNSIISETASSWSRSSNSWVNSIVLNYMYNQSGNLIEKTEFNWSKNDQIWIPRSKEEWSFNENGFPTSHEHKTWSEESEDWVGNWKDEKSYDVNGRLIFEAYYQWDPESNSWIGREKYWDEEKDIAGPGKIEYGYDEAGNMILHASYAWSSRSNDWRGYEITSGKKEWEYDYDGRLNTETTFDWDYDLKDWIAQKRNVLEYDDIGDPLLQYQYGRDPESENWDIVLKYFYHYSQSSGSLVLFSPLISIFPNPTSGIINITGLTKPAKIKLYSVQGQLLISKNQGVNNIDISDMPVGVYFLGLSSDDLFMWKTIIKK